MFCNDFWRVQKPGDNSVATRLGLNVRSSEEVTKKESEVKKKNSFQQ